MVGRKETGMNDILTKILQNGEKDYYALSDTEKMVFSLKHLFDAVCGKGLIIYFKSTAGAYVSDAIDALYSLGVDEIAAVLEGACCIFPDGMPPEDSTERLDIISELEEEYSDLFDEWTDEILEFISPLKSELQGLINELE